MTEKEKLEKIADFYGYEAQSRQLVEEMSELIQAINKKWRNDKRYIAAEERRIKDEVITELADVRIMLEQVEYLLGVKKEVAAEIKIKIERQMLWIKKKGEVENGNKKIHMETK